MNNYMYTKLRDKFTYPWPNFNGFQFSYIFFKVRAWKADYIRRKTVESLRVWTAPSLYMNQCWDIVNWTIGTNFSEIAIEIQTFSFKKMHLKMSYGKWRPFCLGLQCVKLWMPHPGSTLIVYIYTSDFNDILIAEIIMSIFLGVLIQLRIKYHRWEEIISNSFFYTEIFIIWFEFHRSSLENESTINHHWFEQWLNPLRTRQSGRHFTDNIFKCHFMIESFALLFEFHLNLFPMVQLTKRFR